MDHIINLLIAGIISGSVISVAIGLVFHRRTMRIEEEIRTRFQSGLELSRSRREWRERTVSELLGPIYMQLERTERAFDRWKAHDLYLEAKVIGEGNRAIRDLLLEKGHLIPLALLDDAGMLVEHYDYWLEEFEKKRLAEEPDLDAAFIFAIGYPFPRESAKRFREAFVSLRNELHGSDQVDEIDAG